MWAKAFQFSTYFSVLHKDKDLLKKGPKTSSVQRNVAQVFCVFIGRERNGHDLNVFIKKKADVNWVGGKVRLKWSGYADVPLDVQKRDLL